MHVAILGVKRGENEGGESGSRRLLLAGVCAPVTAVAVGRVGYHAHCEEEPPPVDHSHGRRRQAAAASLEASHGARWHRGTSPNLRASGARGYSKNDYVTWSVIITPCCCSALLRVMLSAVMLASTAGAVRWLPCTAIACCSTLFGYACRL